MRQSVTQNPFVVEIQRIDTFSITNRATQIARTYNVTVSKIIMFVNSPNLYMHLKHES